MTTSPAPSGEKKWTVYVHRGTFLAVLMEGGTVIRHHPIGFETEREALRAVDRLNLAYGWS